MRRSMNKRKSRKTFRKTSGAHPANFRGAMRGGYRL